MNHTWVPFCLRTEPTVPLILISIFGLPAYEATRFGIDLSSVGRFLFGSRTYKAAPPTEPGANPSDDFSRGDLGARRAWRIHRDWIFSCDSGRDLADVFAACFLGVI